MKFFSHKLLFKIYLVFVILLFLTFDFISEDPLTMLEYIDYTIWLISLLGVFGYAFNKKIFNKQFWQVLLLFKILWDVFVNFHDFDFSYTTQAPKLAFLFLLFLILIPTYVAIYLYGHENVDQSIKNRTKILLSIIVIVLISNTITYKLSYDKSSETNFLAQVRFDAMLLKAYDKNDTRIIRLLSPMTINSLFYMANNEESINKYSSVCREIDAELLAILDKFSIENDHLYQGDSNITKDLRDIRKRTRKGRLKIVELCKKQKQ